MELVLQILSRRNFCNRTHIGLHDFEYPPKPFEILDKPIPQLLKIAFTAQFAGVKTDWRIVKSIERFAKRLRKIGYTLEKISLS